MVLHQLYDDVDMAEDEEQRRIEAGEGEAEPGDGEGAAAAPTMASPGGEGRRAAGRRQPPGSGDSGAAVPMEGIEESDDDEEEGEEDADAAQEPADAYLGVAPCPPKLLEMYYYLLVSMVQVLVRLFLKKLKRLFLLHKTCLK